IGGALHRHGRERGTPARKVVARDRCHSSTQPMLRRRDMMADNCTHDKLQVRLFCPDCGEEFEKRELTRAEIEAQAVELPDREAMSLVNANVAIPINLAAALNVLSDNATAGAIAQQGTPITQGI